MANANGIGASIPRKEDLRFLKGEGRYTDDLRKPDQLYAAFVRAERAHATIGSIRSEAASRVEGVVAVLTGEDYRADGHGPIPHQAIEGNPADEKKPAFTENDPVALCFGQWPLPFDKVRHAGEAVAVVIAVSGEIARDAAGLVEVELDELPPVVSPHQAMADGAPLVWNEAPGNLCIHAIRGQPEKTSEALAASDFVVSGEFAASRIVSCFMEPRAGIAEFVDGRYVVTAGNQGVHRYRQMIAGALRAAPEQVRVICPDTGGGFGSRSHINPEYVVIAWAARRLDRPVRFTNDRSESFLADWQGRDMILKGELGLAEDGRFMAYRLSILANNGAHTVCYAPQANATRLFTTVYDVPAACLEHKVFLTNTASVLPFRAAGRPEVTYAIERLIDRAAHRLGFDRKEIRLKNMIRPDAMPYSSPAGLTYDVGDFPAAFERAAEIADWNGYESRRRATEARGLKRGIAIVPFVESPVGAPVEMVRVRLGGDGKATVQAGTQNHGQGHETTYAQVIGELLGIPFGDVALEDGDSDALPFGGGTHSDRSMRMAGELLCEAADDLVAQALPDAARLMQADEKDIVFENGIFRSAGAAVGIVEIAAARSEAGVSDGLAAEAARRQRIPAFPYGAAVAEVEIDPDTGETAIDRYSSVNDAGTPINPMIVHGQTHGGIVQGAGQAIGENAVYDPSSGQLTTGSFMDYAMPRADWFPSFRLDEVDVPTHGNRLGVKAAGEAGTVPALAIVGNAVLDALRPLGVTECEMPFTACRIRKAIQERSLSATPDGKNE